QSLAASMRGIERFASMFRGQGRTPHLSEEPRLSPNVKNSMEKSEVGSHPKEVLVVEDEAIIRMAAADALAEHGIMAWEATDSEEALKSIEQHPRIGLLFTDVDMPGKINGLGLAHEVIVTHPDVELIVTSGAVTLRSDDLPDHGTFLPKPYSTRQMVAMVTRKLDR
ncbi:MAG: response regulator, partial [Sphingomicrobium sp.]